MNGNFLRIMSLALPMVLSACGSKIEDLKSTSRQSTVPTTETDGVVTAQVNPNAPATLVASASGTLADSSIDIKAGTLAIDTTVDLKLGVATDQTSAIGGSLGFSSELVTAANSTTPLFIGPSGQAIATKLPMVLNLPLPVTASGTKLNADGSKLKSDGTLALIYLVYTSTGYVAGIKPLATTDLSGIFVSTSVGGLGFFRIIYLPIVIEAKEVTVQYTPSIKAAG